MVNLSFHPPSLTLDSVPHSCSPAEMTISDSDTGPSGRQDPCCVDFAPSRRYSGLNGIRLSSKNGRFAVILTLTSSHFISSPVLSRAPTSLFPAKETPHTDSKTTKKETRLVCLTRVAIFFSFLKKRKKKQASELLISVT